VLWEREEHTGNGHERYASRVSGLVVSITFVDTVALQGWSDILKDATVCPTVAEDIPLERCIASLPLLTLALCL
jgi:hypothetical protein